MTPQDIAERGLVLRGVVGSECHGIQLEGTGDTDMMGVCVEPPEYVIGLCRFEQHIYRTAEERQRHNSDADQRYHGRTPRSEPGDVDLVIYSLRKYASLAAKGNPSILLLLFAEPNHTTTWGKRLQDNAHLFASREAGARFLGYLQAQRQRLLGERGQMRVTRTELVDRHGFDVKFASHAIRLGYQGGEFLTSGRITLPMDDGRDYCLAVRRGEIPLSEVVEHIAILEEFVARLAFGPSGLNGKRDLRDGLSPLPERPDRTAIDKLLVEIYAEVWEQVWAGAGIP